jgi:pyruvate dehydrogenase E1 component alpha subunit
MREDFRSKEEVKTWKDKCPIKRFEAYLLTEEVTQEQLDQIGAEVEKEMKDAFEFAVNSPYPDATWATEDVYTNLAVEVDKA